MREKPIEATGVLKWMPAIYAFCERRRL